LKKKDKKAPKKGLGAPPKPLGLSQLVTAAVVKEPPNEVRKEGRRN